MAVPDDLEDWLSLLQVPGVGPARARALADGLGGPGAVLAADSEVLTGAGLDAAARGVLRSPDRSVIDRTLEWLERDGRGAVTLGQPAYPALLSTLSDAPPVLFTVGDAARLSQPLLAIVGSRNPTRPGSDTAADFAASLCGCGLGVVSGLALGIDAAAHRGVLEAGGLTVAVAGHGLDTVYPRRHRGLAARIAETGVLVSEFTPGTRPLREHFPRRNRIIAGLSLGVLVVEAAVHSGSLITARQAADQGREVFAIPGSIHNPMARGCHRLIRDGAKLVETVEDLLEELGWSAIPSRHEPQSGMAEDAVVELDDDYVTLLRAMGHDPAPVDILVQRTGLTPQALSSMLLTLELRGIVLSVPGTGYVRTAKRE